MGNYISCTLLGPVRKNSARATKVIFPSGEIRRLDQPTKAAELMLEVPNSFIVSAKSMQIGKRFAALNADEELDMGNAYVFFPMSRLNTAATAADVAALFVTANSVSKRAAHGGARISPEVVQSGGEGMSPVARLNLENIEEYSTPEFQHRLSMCRSKKPLLETIIEEPGCVR
ncbi:tRNA (guanine-N(1)-)-methyltransferase [Striga asiatica]|uniref:tRNA (Guanine-N(1)-)-methyltransferase n=1 Tax=Striga asiatica TaxID=4170 RepID=A0A5A7QW23_STRAF|nr:tRNA (guanine-N(1)-)-methyltransferase [Striga asiatica]